MKRKDLFIPFYLEYAGCCKFGDNNGRVIFRRADYNVVLVEIISDKSISISEIPSTDHYELERLGENESKALVDRLRIIIWKGYTDVSVILDSKNYNPIKYEDKNLYLLTIFNCISTDFYTNKVYGVEGIYEYWRKMSKLDEDRLAVGDRYYSKLYSMETRKHESIRRESRDTNMAIAISLYHTFTIYDIIGSKLSIQVRDYFNERFGRYEFRVKGVLEMINNLKRTVESTDGDLSSNAYEEIREKLSYCNNILKN